MAAYRWPTDPPNKAPSHTITWQQHQANLKGQPSNLGRGGLGLGLSQTAPIPAHPSAATPAPAAAPGGVQIQPNDPIYKQAEITANRDREATLGNLAGERTRTLNEYGFQEGSFDPKAYDPSNPGATYGTRTFDASNPFSRAALLKQTYDTSRRTRAQQMGSAGQLYSGAFQNEQDLINRGQLQEEDTLDKSLTGWLAQNTIDYGQAGTDYTNAISQAAAERQARIPDNPLYQPAAAPTAPAPITTTRGAGLPQKTNAKGQRLYQRASDKKWIPY